MFLPFFNNADKSVMARVKMDKEPSVSRREEKLIARAEAKAAKAEAKANKKNR